MPRRVSVAYLVVLSSNFPIEHDIIAILAKRNKQFLLEHFA